MNKNYLVWGAVAVVVIGALYFFMQGYSKPSTEVVPANSTVVEVNPTQVITQATTSAIVAVKTTVDYTVTGFTPKSVTIKIGDTVTWTNKSGSSMWIASAPHPTHADLPGFDELKAVEKDGTYSYTFTKAGNWKYHNHMSPKDGGVVVVQ